MQAGNSRPRFFASSSVIVALSLLACLAASVRVQAQKKPPILTDHDISAFSKKAIEDLQTHAADVTHPGEAKLARNKLVAITVEQIDTAFNDFRTKSRKRTDTLSFLFDFLEIGASSAISIVGGSRPKALIGEGLSLFQGSRSAFNKDFRFLERQILFNKMVAKRSDKLTAIYKKLDETVEEYPWEQARSELRDYFFAGTIDEALTSLNVDTGAQAQTAEAALIEAKKAAGIAGVVTPAAVKADTDAATRIDALRAASNAAQTPADKAKVLDKMKAIFLAADDSSILHPFMSTISQSSPGMTIGDEQRQRIEDSIKKARDKTGSFDDYFRVLSNLRLAVVRIVDTNPIPNNELQRILTANQ